MTSQIIRALASAGADLNAARVNGQTASITAARFGKANSLRALAERGADLALVDSMGETAARKAVRSGDTACAEMIRAFELARNERVALAAAIAGRASSPSTPSRARSL